MVSLVIITQLNPPLLQLSFICAVGHCSRPHPLLFVPLSFSSFFSLSCLPFFLSLFLYPILLLLHSQSQRLTRHIISLLSLYALPLTQLSMYPSRFSPSTQLPPSFVCPPWLLALLLSAHTTICIRTVLSGALTDSQPLHGDSQLSVTCLLQGV